ncbi:hypothetical protein D4764_08G0005040 [Takifugu flavidus]|uniref:Uncharacterized protein n=1 Tax=Takifugu flavidus TaxID=433684 RepID=A0A5C6MSZ1_9TELE|nr:hypothetical protein D4764_08G0005040 [Takifugu flavidus]
MTPASVSEQWRVPEGPAEASAPPSLCGRISGQQRKAESSSISSGAGMDSRKVRTERRMHLGENYTPLWQSAEQQRDRQDFGGFGSINLFQQS